jgi:hypothetical protein
MQPWLDHPAVQAGVVPLVVALLVATALVRTRLTWLAVVAGYAAMIAMTVGFSFSPLSASRKVILAGLLAPLIGIAAGWLPLRGRGPAFALSVAASMVAIWVFATVLQQRQGMANAVAAAAGIALFVAAQVYATLRVRDDGLRVGAAGLGLGLATGIAAVLSASIGYFFAGISIAAAAGALLLVQVVASRGIAAGFTGALPIGVLTALFAAGTTLLADLRWYVLPLMLLPPLATSMRVPERAPLVVRAALLSAYACVAAAVPILAAWYSARGSLI